VITLVVDVGLPPAWVSVFTKHGWPAVHWSSVGDPRAKDSVVMAWAREHGRVVFTHDLDFGTLLALTRANGPSVIQLRAQDVLPDHLEGIVAATIRRYESHLRDGALVTVDEARGKVRMLPIGLKSKH
jgi:predicted nuclease of predicted toxin-antitoxin system